MEAILHELGDLHLILVMACVFGAVALFVVVGVRMFSSGWESYEQQYVGGTQETLDAMYLTIPPEHVVYLSVASFLLLAVFWIWIFGNLFVGLIFGLMGLAVPKLVLWWLKKRRDQKFDRQLVEALTNMGNSLKAGFSLAQALELVAREMENPMGQEMGLVVREMRVGVPMEEALEHLHDRMPSQDLDLVISSVTISREVGGNLTEIFDNISNTVRERHQIEGRIQALSAQGKLQGFVIVAIPPAMGLALSYIAPGMIRPLVTTPIGWGLMFLVAILMGLGIYTIYRIVAIEF